MAQSADAESLVVGTASDGLPVRRAARMGEAFLTSCVIRLDGDPADPTTWARRHDNNSHRSLNVSGPPEVQAVDMIRNGHHIGGVLRVPFVESRPVAFAFAGADEATPSLGVDIGVSGGVESASLVFWHREQARYLDVTTAGDRALVTGQSVNVWFVVLSVGF